MIKYLQGLKNKKGFTLVELIIVIAIIAVLIGISAPLFSNDDGKKRSADIYASDFYSLLQYNFTRYNKTEAPVSPRLAAETDIMLFDKDKAANVFAEKNGDYIYVYIEAYYDNGLKYIHVADTLDALLDKDASDAMTALEDQLLNDMADVVNKVGKGYYYAVVHCNKVFHNISVITVHFCEDRLPDPDTVEGSYEDKVLHIVDNNELANGYICGTCSSDKVSTGGQVGGIGSYFLNIDSITENVIN